MDTHDVMRMFKEFYNKLEGIKHIWHFLIKPIREYYEFTE